MKKIFTLFFCVVAMAMTASADNLIDQCINVLLGNEIPTKSVAAELDANHDGVITIHDVSALIDLALEEQMQLKKTQSQEPIDVDALINDMLDNEPPTPKISDVSEAIDHNLKLKQKKN